MEVIILGFFAPFLLFIVSLMVRSVFNQWMVGREVRRWCRENGHYLESFTIVEHARLAMQHKFHGSTLLAKTGHVVVRFRRPGVGREESVSVVWHAGLLPKLGYPPPNRVLARIEHSPEELKAQALERDVRFEVTRRLNAITSRKGWASEHDLDGSGKIEPNEWEALKKKVEAEVRSEKEDTDVLW